MLMLHMDGIIFYLIFICFNQLGTGDHVQSKMQVKLKWQGVILRVYIDNQDERYHLDMNGHQ